MNLSKLKILVLIAKHQKISVVADLIELKQPTVTFHMKSLEKEMNAKLFQSYPNKITLTEAGHALCHYARKMLSLQEESFRVIQEYQQGHWGSLRVGASNVPATYVLPGLFGAFQQQSPQMHIALIVKTAPQIHEMLQSHEVDLGVISAGPMKSGPIRYEALRNDELVLACLPDHPLTQETDWEPARIALEPFILHETDSTTRQMCDAWAEQCGIRLQARMELGSAEAIKQAILSGIGVSILSRTAIDSEVRKGELWCRRLPGEAPQRHIYLGVNRDRMQTPLLKEFMNFITHSLR